MDESPPKNSSSSATHLSSSDSGDEARFVPGTTLVGRYRIVALLGRGGMGEVYRADDLKLGQAVALKFLPEGLPQAEPALARFHREVRLARQVSHPNVCRVFDIGEADGRPFLTMEYVDGEDLASLLRRIGRLPSDKGLEIARQLCAGVAAAHEHGVVHRDLKPANVMLDGRGRVRITDFGLAGLAGEDGGRAGTPAYMAPEQLSGGEVTPKSDIYSLGLVLYEIFTGKPAFKATTLTEMMRVRDKSAPTHPSQIVKDIDPLVERVILRSLEKDPAKRPPSALRLAAALPGGDPLAAALAAGETPSPEMVAAAGESVAMSTAASLALFAAILLCIAALVFLARYANVLVAIHGAKPPETLAVRAREMITRFGYDENAADSAWWLQANEEDLPQLSRGSPEGMQFVYRQSPRLMRPRGLGSIMLSDDPPANVPGMVKVVLDAQGRLREFSVVPAPGEKHDTAPLDWSALLSEAGFGSAQLTAQDATVLPPTAFDARQDWQATESGQTIAITAAAYNGKAVYFRAASAAPKLATKGGGTEDLGIVMFVVVVAVCGIGGCLLARANMRRGRGDRRGAFRVAAFMFIVILGSWAFTAHFVPAAWAIYSAFIRGCGFALYLAAFMWVLYMALEPHVRRRWPEMLISWTRVLSGNVYDSRVGRDVMLGALGGAAMAVIQNSVNALPAWFHVTGILPISPTSSVLRGITSMLWTPGDLSAGAIAWALGVPSLLVVARFLTRRDWAAVILSGALATLVLLPAQNLVIAIPAAMLCSVIVFTLLFRFGILSVAAANFFFSLLRDWPLTLDFSQWFVWHSVFAMSLLVAIALYAFLAINTGRSIFMESGLDD